MENPNLKDSNVKTTVELFEKIYPLPLGKNQRTQLGVHLEEVVEMIECLKGADRLTQSLLTQAMLANHALALHLKASKPKEECLIVTDVPGLLDALCDQLVTATGVGYMYGFDMAGAFGEVNRSNNSKLDDNGRPIFDADHKFQKGPNYFKPNLRPYLEKIS
jgi:predicted HAD superfamily Cof-like phosphohydrolase